MELEFSGQIFEKKKTLKVSSESSGSRAVPCGRTDGDEAKFAFRNTANAPKTSGLLQITVDKTVQFPAQFMVCIPTTFHVYGVVPHLRLLTLFNDQYTVNAFFGCFDDIIAHGHKPNWITMQHNANGGRTQPLRTWTDITQTSSLPSTFAHSRMQILIWRVRL